MSTHSNIGILYPNGSVYLTFCHYDGYPKRNGAILLKFYKTKESVEKLLENGYLDSIDAYGNIKISDPVDHKPSFIASSIEDLIFPPFKNKEHCIGPYIYLFDIINNKWIWHYRYQKANKLFNDLTCKDCEIFDIIELSNDNLTQKLSKAVLNSWQNFEISSDKNNSSILKCFHCKNELHFGKFNDKFIHEEHCIVLTAEKELGI